MLVFHLSLGVGPNNMLAVRRDKGGRTECRGAGRRAGIRTLAEPTRRRAARGSGAALDRLLNLDLHVRDPAVQHAREKLLAYVGHNIYRMDYPTYKANGWRIGSGPVEAACKTLVNARLCLVGMRWGAPGADGMCHLRALYRGEPSQWRCYWNPPPAFSA